jgi:hypothetical protein
MHDKNPKEVSKVNAIYNLLIYIYFPFIRNELSANKFDIHKQGFDTQMDYPIISLGIHKTRGIVKGFNHLRALSRE